MSKVVIKAEDISKQYRLGLVGTGTVKDDVKRWWYNFRGKEDPFLKIGEANDRSTKGESDYVWSLRDINFEINQGESVGIIGKNGAGKSTLLKILSQVTQPTTGRIYTKGRIASLLEVGTGFHPEMTGRENIYLNGAILGMRKYEITRKLDEIIAFSGVERYIDTPVKRYSSGMYVRLAFAVAAHLESEILIVDEVLAVGDADFQKKCLGKMNDVSKGEGRTILFVSHNMAAVEALCTKGITLKNGNIVDLGHPTRIITDYLLDNSFYDTKISFDSVENAMGNDAVRILYAAVEKNPISSENEIIDVTSDFSIRFKIVNLTQQHTISIGFDLKSMRGDVIFGTGRKFECKTNEVTNIRCEIPKNFLNDDSYQIFLYIHTDSMRLLFMKEELLTFEIKDNKRDSGYLGKINGFLRPQLHWQIDE